MGDRRIDHAAARLNPLLDRTQPRGMPQVGRARARAATKDLFARDHADTRRGGRFRWLVSTCLAGAVGAVAILVVIYGSSDPGETPEGLFPTLKRMSAGVPPPALDDLRRRQDGLRWQVPRSDRLQVTSGAMSMRHTIHEMLRQRVGGRDKIYAKRYVRVQGRLTPVPANYADVIPPFNPLKLFANATPIGTSDQDAGPADARSDVSVKVVELLGGILPEEDGQELAASEVEEIVEGADGPASDAAGSAGTEQSGAGGALAEGMPSPANLQAAQYTTVLHKTKFDAEEPDNQESEQGTLKTVTFGPADTLAKILVAAGADKWQAAAMVEAAEKVFPSEKLAAGQQIDITQVPSLVQQNKLEPVRFSIFEEVEGRREHRVSVARDAAGEFIASVDQGTMPEDLRPSLGDGDQPQAASLYASVYYASLIQKVPSDTILQNLKIHAYDLDFRRRIRAGDQIEMFFDPKDDAAPDGPPGELLYSAITAGGETHRYYRFRTPDGTVDFYDSDGNNSKKFLMRRPVRGDDVRLTSGYGVRYHPLLGERKMHTGVDWAASVGTPILAAGNGVIEEAGRKGQYGNYVRIRHANGYQTAYGHMSRIAEGVEPGAKVRQGQLIGKVGSTGFSSGPHLHYEVLVNTRFVDPMSIQVPRERQLTGKDLEDFQKERVRIDDLMRRAPVKTEMLAGR